MNKYIQKRYYTYYIILSTTYPFRMLCLFLTIMHV